MFDKGKLLDGMKDIKKERLGIGWAEWVDNSNLFLKVIGLHLERASLMENLR